MVATSVQGPAPRSAPTSPSIWQSCPGAGVLITWLRGYPALFVIGAGCAVMPGLLVLRISSIR